MLRTRAIQIGLQVRDKRERYEKESYTHILFQCSENTEYVHCNMAFFTQLRPDTPKLTMPNLFPQGALSARYARSAISIEDVTVLGQRVGKAHGVKREKKRDEAMAGMVPELPVERPYMPMCGREVLVRLALLPGPAADAVGRIGKGMAGGGGGGGGGSGGGGGEGGAAHARRNRRG